MLTAIPSSHAGLPLERFPVVQSIDPIETHDLATAMMNEHRMRLLGTPKTFTADIRRASVSSMQLMFFRYGTDVEIRPAPLDDFVCVHIPLTGRFELISNQGESVLSAGMAAVMSPNDTYRMRWSSDLGTLVLRIDRAVIERKLDAIGGRASGTIEFAPIIAARSPGAAIIHAIRTLQASLDDAGTQGLPSIVAAEFEELVLSMLLTMHDRPCSGGRSGAGRRRAPAGASRQLERITEFVHDNASGRLLARDLAEAAHVSERALYGLIHDAFGCTPMAWVREQRLQRARGALLEATPTGDTTVRGVAEANGMPHTGRFAALYRARFGESPSETLRRSR